MSRRGITGRNAGKGSQIRKVRALRDRPSTEGGDLLRLIADALPVLISYVDKDERYRFNNKEYERLYGYSSGEIYGRHVRDVLGEEAYRDIAKHIRAALSGRQVSYERWFSRNGSERYLNVNYFPDTDEEGNVRGFCVLVNDLTDRVRMEESLRSYAKRLVELEEEQKKRLANELHDQIGRDLTALNLNLNFMNTMLSDAEMKKVGLRLTDSLMLLDGIARHVRNIMSELRPEVLDEYGLLPALRWYGEQVERRTAMSIHVQGREGTKRLDPEVEIALFRIAQEAITNAVKHSSATTVTVSMNRSAGRTVFSVADNGMGFDIAADRSSGRMPGLGLIIIRERAESIGGLMRIDSSPEKGTAIVITVGGIPK